MPQVAVVGHVEWAEFVRVERLPRAGEIVHAGVRWEEPGGGGAVAAVQLARLAGEATFFTAFGDDALGHRAADSLPWSRLSHHDAVYFTAGDAFAAGLTFGLGAGLGRDEALRLAARCGASAVTGRGPYTGQLRASPGAAAPGDGAPEAQTP